MKTELTLERAYKLAVKKWEYIVNNNGDEYGIYKVLPELRELKAGCSYCDLFYYKGGVGGCDECPLKPNVLTSDDAGCAQENHPYYIWNFDQTKANAQAVLDLIIKTKPV